VFPKYVSNSDKCSNVASSTLRMQIKETKTGSKQLFSTPKSNAINRNLSVLLATTATINEDAPDNATNSVATHATIATKDDDSVNESPNNSVPLRYCYDCKMLDKTTNYCSGYKSVLPKPTKFYRCLRFVGKLNVVDLYQQIMKEGIRLKRNGDKLIIQGMKTKEQKNTIICYKEELILLLKVREKLVCIECDTDDLMDWYKDDLPQIEEMSLEELQKRVEGYQKYRIYYRG